MEQAQHRRFLRHVSRDFGNGARLRTRQREGQLQLGAQTPVARQGLSLTPPPLGFDQQQREAVRQQLVISKPVERLGIGRFMPQSQRIGPGGPTCALQLPGFNPFGQRRKAGERLADKIGNARLGQPVRQAIDRLAQAAHIGGTFRLDMIGVNDLEHVAITVEPPCHPALLTDRDELFRAIGCPAEPCQRADIANRILRQHPVRPTAPSPRGAVFDGSERNNHLLALAAGIEIGNRLAADEPFGQVVRDILHPRQAELFERLHQLRPDAFQRRDFGEQRVESLGAHE